MNPLSSLARRASAVLLSTLLSAAALAQSAPPAADAGAWEYAGTLYLYLPSVTGKTRVPADGVTLNFDILEHLKFTVMGSLDAHNGRWGAFTDFIYLDFGDSRSRTRDYTLGGSGPPVGTTADIKWGLKGVSWTVGGQYRVAASADYALDVLGGARLLYIERSSSWSITGDLGPPPFLSGSNKAKDTLIDGIVGVRGRAMLGAGSPWSVPFYLDIGTGESKLTWQAAAGIRYSYAWGDISALYRVLDYDLKSSSSVETLRFYGPMVGATFRW